MSEWLRRKIAFFAVSMAIALFFVFSHLTANAQGGPQWYMVDPHVHSTVSAEAFADIGIHSEAAKNLDYNILFLSDHANASSFHVNGLTANNMVFNENVKRWDSGSFGPPISSTNQLVSSPVFSGTMALELEATSNSATYGESQLWTKRGPNFKSGDIIIDVSIYPTQIYTDSGVYVSVAIGGDPSIVNTPYGYTTEAGVISPGKSTVMVWQLGTPRSDQADPNDRVITNQLTYTLDTWNHYQINVSDVVATIPVADQPVDYNAVVHVKMAAGAVNGTAKAYFDAFKIYASSPMNPADEYVERNLIISDYDTPTFKIFPAYEVGQQTHTQRFNFGITDPSDYLHFDFGHESIPSTHASGYPAQLNHPGTTVTITDVVNTHAHGADFVEVTSTDKVGAWDDVLLQDVPLIGGWSSDSHSGVSYGKRATFLYAPSLDFDDLMKTYFEGRAYIARNYFTGRVLFNLDSVPTEPYPARYPVYVSDAESTYDVSLNITDGLDTDWEVQWIRNGASISNTNPMGSSYQATKSISLAGTSTYVRADVQTASGAYRALSQPIFFRDVADLPVGRSFHIDDIITATDHNYNKSQINGIVRTSWSTVYDILEIILYNPVDALVRLHMETAVGPQTVKVDGVSITVAASLSAFNSATGNSWYYDGGLPRLYLKVLHANTGAQLDIEFNGPDLQEPEVPTNVNATAVHIQRIDVNWAASTDDLAVGGYTVYRNGNPIATVSDTTLGYSDTTVAASTTYSYTVEAFDTYNNVSAKSSPPVLATTPSTSTFTFSVEADSYVNADLPTNNYGSSASFRADNSDPIQNGYLRFNMQGLVGMVTNARLRIYAGTTSSIGYDIQRVADNSWVESGINFNNAPLIGGLIDSSDSYSQNSWTETDVTSQVKDNGLLSFALTTSSNTGLKFTSREGSSGNGAELVVVVGGTLPGTVELLSPLGTITTTSPSFSWRPESMATGYTLLVYDETNDVIVFSNAVPYATSICTGNTPTDACTVQPAGLSLPAASYRWLVQASNNAGDGPWSTYQP